MEPYLVVDMASVLDKSAVGRTATASLEAEWASADAEHRRRLQDAARASGASRAKLEAEAEQLGREALSALEQRRAALRVKLLARVGSLVRDLAKERGAGLVLERSAVLVFAQDADVTHEVIRRLDALGELGELG